MTRVEVLCATMNQKDFSLFEKMNIQTDVIFCNQCDRNEFSETTINGCHVRMLSTTTRGVGINRNLALQLSDAEICLFADDDIVYVDGYERIITSAFDRVKKADAIIFNRKNADGTKTDHGKSGFTKKGAGAVRLAIRNKVVKHKNLQFSTSFGGGSNYISGEDTLFVKNISGSGCKIYKEDIVICALTDDRDSTWFKGYTDKFFFDKGALVRAMYPKTWRMSKYYLLFKFRYYGEQSFIKKIKLMNKGAEAYKNMKVYDDFIKNYN